MLCLNDVTFFVNYTSPSCSKIQREHNTAAPILPSWKGLPRLPIFPFLFQMEQSYINIYISFFSDHRTFVIKSLFWDLQSDTLCCFWSNSFSPAQKLLLSCQQETYFAVDIYTLGLFLLYWVKAKRFLHLNVNLYETELLPARKSFPWCLPLIINVWVFKIVYYLRNKTFNPFLNELYTGGFSKNIVNFCNWCLWSLNSC